MKNTPSLKDQLTDSLDILRTIDHSITDTTKAAKIAFENWYKDPTPVNQQIMNCAYVFLIIRASAFYDELKWQFLKNTEAKVSEQLNEAITHFETLYKQYHVRKLRNYLVHNRKFIKKEDHRPITDDDLAEVSGMQSHNEFSSLQVATNRIIAFIDQI